MPETGTSVVLNITNTKSHPVKTLTLTNGSGQVSLGATTVASGTFNYTVFLDGTPVGY